MHHLSIDVSGHSLESFALCYLGNLSSWVSPQDNPWRFSMASSYPKASSNACSMSGPLQKATRTAFIFFLFFSFLILREFFPRPLAGCHSQLAFLKYCQEIRSPLPKFSAFSPKNSSRKLFSCICCSAYTEEKTSAHPL